MPAKKQTARRRPRKKQTARMPSRVAAVAQRVVNRNIETKKKQATINETNLSMTTAPIGYKVINDVSYQLTQGDGYSNMTGHHVKASGHSSHMYFFNTNAYSIFGRLMWIYSRSGILPTDVSATGGYLMENNGGDATLGNNLLELHQRVNKDQFLVLKSWDFKLGQTDGTSSVPAMKRISHYHNHKGRKLIYNGSNTFPVNGRFFYVVMLRRADNDGTPVSGVELSAVHNLFFKDA